MSPLKVKCVILAPLNCTILSKLWVKSTSSKGTNHVSAVSHADFQLCLK